MEDHADALAQDVDVYLAVQVDAVDEHLARDLAVGDEVVHAVKRLQKGGFAAAGRADKRSDLLFLNVHGDALERMEIAVIEVQIVDVEFIGTNSSLFCHFDCILIFHRLVLLFQFIADQFRRTVDEDGEDDEHDRDRPRHAGVFIPLVDE